MVKGLFVGKKEKIVFVLFIMLCLLSLLCFTSPLFASEPDCGFLGIGPAMNGDTRHGISYGGVLLLGIDINNQFSAGLKTSFFDNLDTVSANETTLFLRYYFPLSENVKGPFLQLEGGGVIFFERGYHEYLEAFPALSGGLSVGWRLNIGNYMYIEPAGRAGYPHIWGASITIGIRFKNKNISKDETDKLSVAQTENNAQIDDNANQIESNVSQVDNNADKKESNLQIDININKINTNVNQNENKNTGRERMHEVH
jgi:hypothetical protein